MATKPSGSAEKPPEQLRYQGYFKDSDGNFFIETKTEDDAKAIATRLFNSPFQIKGGNGGPKWAGPHDFKKSGLKFGVVITPANLGQQSIDDFIGNLNLRKESSTLNFS